MRHALLIALCLGTGAQAATEEGELVVPCGGSFATFKDALRAEAVRRGADPATARTFFDAARQDQSVLAADRRQGVFALPFTDFARRLISQDRIDRGQQMSRRYDDTFQRIEQEFGLSRGVLLAFWAFETDYGAVQGDFDTVDALMTLSHDCRRPNLFQPQVLAALELFARGDMGLDTTGAWAGEIGQVQMLPGDIIANGRDGDGDGHVTLKTSAPDALMSGASVLSSLGWTPGQPWLEEVVLPSSMDWSKANLDTKMTPEEWGALGLRPRDGSWDGAGLQASLLLPQGKDGPAFLGYPNFDVFFEWNQSYTYVLTAAYFATRLEGSQVFDAGNPPPALPDADMKSLQRKLQARGHDVGEVDGILGAGTRAAVRAEQNRLGLPADAWPTRQLLDAL